MRKTLGGGGLGMLLVVVTLILVALKLEDVIGWSWWWVLAPIWVPAAALVLFVAVGLAYVIVLTKLNERCQS